MSYEDLRGMGDATDAIEPDQLAELELGVLDTAPFNDKAVVMPQHVIEVAQEGAPSAVALLGEEDSVSSQGFGSDPGDIVSVEVGHTVMPEPVVVDIPSTDHGRDRSGPRMTGSLTTGSSPHAAVTRQDLVGVAARSGDWGNHPGDIAPSTRTEQASNDDKPAADAEGAAAGGGYGGDKHPPQRETLDGSDDPHEHAADAPLIEAVLGVSLERLQVVLPPDKQFSERGAILAEARRVIGVQRATYQRLAAQFNISEKEARNWQPNEQDVASLRGLLRSERQRIRILEGVDAWVNDPSRMERLRPVQRDAMWAIRDFLEFAPRSATGGKASYIVMPTGTGKTGTFLSFLEAAKLFEDPDDPVSSTICSPRLSLTTQTIGGDMDTPREQRKGIAKFAPQLLSQVSEHHSQAKGEVGPIELTVDRSVASRVAAGTMPPRDTFVIDEVHTSLGPTNSEAILRYITEQGGKEAVTIGFTATDAYDEERTVANLIPTCIFRFPLKNAVKTGQLAPVVAQVRRLAVHINEAELPDEPQERRDTITAARIDEWLADAMPKIKATVAAGLGVLVRCPPGGDISWARYAVDIIRGELPEVYSKPDGSIGRVRITEVGGTKQSPVTQQRLLDLMNSGGIQVIAYVEAVNLGVDVPAKLLVNLAKASPVQLLQAAGRVLRLQFDDQGRPIEAAILDYEDPADPRDYTIDDAFELRPGETRIRATGTYTSRYTPRPLVFRQVAATSVDVSTTEVAIAHDDNPEARSPVVETLSFAQACAEFGVAATVMEAYLRDLGFEAQPFLPVSEYEAVVAIIREYEPSLGTEDTPTQTESRVLSPSPEGYTTVSEVMRTQGWRGSMRDFLSALRAVGIRPRRFSDAEGKTQFYLPDELL